VVWASSAVSLLILMSPLLILRRGRLRMSRADVAAAFGPFVVLFGEDGADEADQRIAVGKMRQRRCGAGSPGSVAPGVVGPDLTPQLLGEGGKGQDVGASPLQLLRDAGQLVGESVDDPIELGVHTGCVGLVVDAVQQAFTPDTVDFEPVTLTTNHCVSGSTCTVSTHGTLAISTVTARGSDGTRRQEW
jgi:hypothetical protein